MAGVNNHGFPWIPYGHYGFSELVYPWFWSDSIWFPLVGSV